MRLDRERVHVLENGAEVSNFSLLPASQAGARQFGVVLVIDASRSMRGAPIRRATAAAREFVAQRAPSQQIGIVSFNSRASVLLRPTTDHARIQAALADEPLLALETHVYDGVRLALDLLREAKVSSGSIVVLSDGTDTGSTATREEVVAAARAAHVRVFTVGLRSRQFTPSALAALALDGGGRYSEAGSAAELERIYAELGSQLASEYLLRYRSLAGPNIRVKVKVRIDGVRGAATHGYLTPRLSATPTPPYHRSLASRFWESAFSAFLITLLAASLVGLALVALFRPRNRNLRKRMAQFVSVVLPGERTRRGGLLGERVLVGAERGLERTRWWSRFKQDVELAEIRAAPLRIVVWTVLSTVLAAWLLSTVGGSSLFAVLALLVPLGVRSVIKRRVDKRRGLFTEQLPDNLQVLASALRAGHSFVGALSVVVDDAPEPTRTEFARVVADEQLGVPLDAALDSVVQRMQSRELEQVALVAALQRQTGGNSAEVLDRVTDTIRERAELRRLVKTLTVQGRMSRWIVSILPAFLLVVISAINPGYISPLFERSAGRVLLVVATLMVVAGSLVIRRIVNIKV